MVLQSPVSICLAQSSGISGERQIKGCISDSKATGSRRFEIHEFSEFQILDARISMRDVKGLGLWSFRGLRFWRSTCEFPKIGDPNIASNYLK